LGLFAEECWKINKFTGRWRGNIKRYRLKAADVVVIACTLPITLTYLVLWLLVKQSDQTRITTAHFSSACPRAKSREGGRR